MIKTEAGMVVLLERKLQELNKLLAIPAMQRRIVRKDLDCLVGKILFVHLVVPGAAAHFYHIQCTLKQVDEDRAWILPKFYQEIDDWETLVAKTVARPTHLKRTPTRGSATP